MSSPTSSTRDPGPGTRDSRPGTRDSPVPCIVLGGTGYVAGELLRVLGGHPVFRVASVVSSSRAGEPVAAVFPHLAHVLGEAAFDPPERTAELLAQHPELAIVSGLPHGEAAAALDALLAAAEKAGCAARVVDCSADFRHADPQRYAAVYGHPHGAPGRLAQFACALPEHWRALPPQHVAHPGCFTTAVTLAVVPLLATGLVEPRVVASAVTGSTGAGRKLTATTHHPERRSDLFAYAPLGHRHEPEMRALAAAAAGTAEPEITFLPHAGPFARGIHATLHARLARSVTAAEALAEVASFYAQAPFVRVLPEPPHLAAVAGTNRADLHVAVRGGEIVAFSVLDNLVKGAAGGAVQWLNRLYGLPETAGLELPGLGWL